MVTKKLFYMLTGIVILIGICLASWSDYKAGKKFCSFEMNGAIDSIIIGEHGSYKLKIKNKWYYLDHCGMSHFNVQIGDTLMKKKDCFKVYLLRYGIKINICENGNHYLPCDCD